MTAPRNPIIGRARMVPLRTEAARKLADHFLEEAFHQEFARIEDEARLEAFAEVRRELRMTGVKTHERIDMFTVLDMLTRNVPRP